MPILTPPDPFQDGVLVTAAMLNAMINQRISELQTGTARGVLYSAASTARVAANSMSWIDCTGTVGSFSVDSPRTLQAIAQVSCIGVGGTSQIISIRATINGVESVSTDIRIEQAGGSGAVKPNMAGVAIPVPQGTVNVALQIRRLIGSGDSVDAREGSVLQIIDQGAS